MNRFILAAAAVVALGLFSASPANAQYSRYHGHGANPVPRHYSNYGSNYGFNYNSGPVYHAPSLHYDSVYHPTYSHWTPGRGLHTHGHYDLVPHFTPGHFDYQHGDHLHTNPWYHH